MPKTKTLPTWTGHAIRSEIVLAIEALPAEAEIVTMSAGENMPIRCAFITEGYYVFGNNGLIPEYAWDGKTWQEIGHL